MKRKMNYLAYIMAGIRNKPGRNAATAFCFAFIAASIFSGQYLNAGASGSVGQGVSRMGADLAVVPAVYAVLLGSRGPDSTMPLIRVEPSTYRINGTVMDAIRKVEGVTALSPQLYVATVYLLDFSSSPIDIYGIDPETDFTIRPWLQAPLEAPLGPGDVIVGNDIHGKVSAKISISGNVYTIRGRLNPTRSTIDQTIFVRMDDAYSLAAVEGVVPSSAPRIHPGDINGVLIRLGPEPAWFRSTGTLEFKPSYPEFEKEVIMKLFEPTYATAIGRHFSLEPVSKEISGIPGLLSIISGVVVAAALPLLALVSSMAANERRREIGLLRSMGAKRRIVALFVVAESLFLACIGGIAGVVGSLGFSRFWRHRGCSGVLFRFHSGCRGSQRQGLLPASP
jgi:putative ABC transport system permease protein